jgi:hypothetical protein
MKTWIRVGVKIKTSDGFEPWVTVQSVDKSSREVSTLPKLEGKAVAIEGYLSSWKPKESQENPNPTEHYEVTTSLKGLQPIETPIVGTRANHAMVRGKIEELKQSASGTWYARIAVRYYKPVKQEYGVRKIRVQCPASFDDKKIKTDSVIFVSGSLRDTNGPCIVAESVQLCSGF